jgi:4-hydroxy-3-polyprenylbenzoate decarboxylase
MPVAANLFGSSERICLALGVKALDDLAHEIETLTTPAMPKGFVDALRMLPLVNRLTDLMPKTVKDAPCQEVIEPNGGLDELPILKTWPEDGGPFITLPLVFTKDPETGMRNVGTYRMQVFDRRTTGMHWQRHKGGAQHHRVAERLGRRLEVAAVLGADPVLTYSATAPMPEGLDELMLAGVLGKRRVELVKCRTVDLEVPANAQIVLEGYVEPGERRREGPFGDHTGFYSLADDFPVFHLQCITMRRNPVYVTTVVGIPPMEDYYLGRASERIFLPLIRKTLPEIVDMHFPAAGIFHNIVLVSIDKRYPGHARKVMSAFWGLGQLMFSKCIVVVDKDVNVQDEAEVAWVAGTHVDPARDIQIVTGPVDDLDDAALQPAFGGKMGIDATRKWPSEGFTRQWPKRLTTTEAAARKAEAIWTHISRR